MPNLQANKNYVLVERLDKVRKRDPKQPFVSVITSANLGTVKFSSEQDYPVGVQVYFGGQHETILIEGAEILAMKLDNILAKVLE